MLPTTWASAASMTSRRCSVSSAAQPGTRPGTHAERRGPYDAPAAAGPPSRRAVLRRRSGTPAGRGCRRGSAPRRESSTARRHRGIQCSRFAFICAAGMVHTRSSESISVHCAQRTSPHRAAVSTNASAAFDTRTVATAHATSRCGSARMCRTSPFCLPSTGPSRSHGLSEGRFIADGHSITALMRWRTFRAVWTFTCQIGVRTSGTSALATSDTDRLSMRRRRGVRGCSARSGRGWDYASRAASAQRRGPRRRRRSACCRRGASRPGDRHRSGRACCWSAARGPRRPKPGRCCRTRVRGGRSTRRLRPAPPRTPSRCASRG